MFELMLMRHAKSDWNSQTSDIDRPLNERGSQDAIRVGRYLASLSLLPDKMIVSSALRTRKTAELLTKNLPVSDNNIIFDDELYLAETDTLCGIINLYASENQRLLILAHNPGMDYLVSTLASKAPTLSDSGKLMTTCAVACFVIDSPEALKKPGQCELLHLIRPGEIPAVL